MAKKKNKKKVKPVPTSWVVAYIDRAHLKNVEHDLAKEEAFDGVVAYIPTVKILKKQFKGEQEFEEVPLLFNYGFFQIPTHKACSKAYLDLLKERVSGIFAWVYDPAKVVAKKPDLYAGNNIYYADIHVSAATATSEEIAALVDSAREESIFSSKEIDKVKVGDIITLRGYPWEGMDAKVLYLDIPKKKLKVLLLLFQQMKEVMVSFDSVFFTMYRDNLHDPNVLSKTSIEDLKDKNILDKLTLKNY